MKDETCKPIRPDGSRALPDAVSEAAEAVPRGGKDGVRQASDGDLPVRYQVWRCNGVSIGLHFHNEKRNRRQVP